MSENLNSNFQKFFQKLRKKSFPRITILRLLRLHFNNNIVFSFTITSFTITFLKIVESTSSYAPRIINTMIFNSLSITGSKYFSQVNQKYLSNTISNNNSFCINAETFIFFQFFICGNACNRTTEGLINFLKPVFEMSCLLE